MVEVSKHHETISRIMMCKRLTRLSIMIIIAQDCWDELKGDDERMGMMKMIYYCFIKSEASYCNYNIVLTTSYLVAPFL